MIREREAELKQKAQAQEYSDNEDVNFELEDKK